MSRVILMHMGKRGWSKKAQLISTLTQANAPIRSSTLYSRLNGETDWLAHELPYLARALGCSIDALFEDPDQMTSGQNWKEKNYLRSIDGGGKVNGQGRILFPTSA